MILGSHVSLGGTDQFLGSVEEAIAYGANALMVYTGAPQNTIRKPILELKIPEAHGKMAVNGIMLDNIIVHAPYIVNLANPDLEKREFAIDFLSEEVRRTEALGSRILVLHPGAHLNQGVEKGIELIIQGVNAIISNTPSSHVRIALEGMAGKGTEVGRNFAELAAIISGIKDKSRVGVCFDTCHSHDAGYRVKDDIDQVLTEFDAVIGLDKLLCVHVNDSKNPLGAHKDRHSNIGFGELGFATIDKVVHHELLVNIPKILETPYVKSEKYPNKSYPPYKREIEMIKARKFDPDLIGRIIADHETS
ncbi:MAG: deoxyribonuclease IV [Bacilli bacterium]|nr:deoxyribonuclease IV [Bacilli bacterium]